MNTHAPASLLQKVIWSAWPAQSPVGLGPTMYTSPLAGEPGGSLRSLSLTTLPMKASMRAKVSLAFRYWP
ncbi:hypothetical protein FQZ97_392990 [compost metagenome]